MGNERVSSFVISFDGEAGTIDQVLNGIKSSMRSAVADIERTTSKLDLFGDITRNLPAVQAALDRTKERVAAFRAEIDGIKAAGAVPVKALTDALKDAEKAASAAEKELKKQTNTLGSLDAELKLAKVDTSNLAAEQLRLAQASKVASAAAAEQAAKQLLGVKTLADAQPQIAKLQVAFETLRTSGTLSAKEIAIAQQAMQAKIKDAQGEVSKLGFGAKALGNDLSSALTGGVAQFAGVTAVVGGLTAAIQQSLAAAKEYKQQLAEIGTVTNLTDEQLNSLGVGARRLARDIGVDLQEAMKALFEIIRSGVPPDNALAVLEVSAKAAKASLTDLATTSKVSALLIDGFGLDVSDLGGAFDRLIKGAHDGGATLKEFAESGGPLLNVARASGVAFDDLVATLTVMTDASNDAAGSAATLTKIIVKLGDPEVRGNLRGLGIETTNLLEVFKQLGDRNIPLQQFLDLGIASNKTAAGVAALTNNAGKLAPELDKIKGAAGETEKAVTKLYDSPKERAARFDAALHDTSVQFGLLFGSGSRLAAVGTSALNTFNNFFASLRAGGPVLALMRSDTGRLVAALLGIKPAAEGATKGADATAQALKKAGEEADAAQAKINAANAALGASAKNLLTEIQALQAASTRDVADINTRADAEIAALDRSAKATAETAAKTIAIQTKQASDRLEVIQQSEKDILAAVNAATSAREAVQRKAGVSEGQIANDTAKIRIDALAPVLKQYQDHYNALVALAQSYQTKINAIAQERDSFADDIRKRTDAINSQGRSALDQYAANLKEIDRLISASAIAAAKGETQRARQLTDEAIARSGQIKEVLGRDGEVIINKYDAIATATNRTKKAEDGYLASLDQQDDAAKAGFDAASKGIDEVKPKLEALQATYDTLKINLEHGLIIKVQTDEKNIAEELAKIDELTKPRVIPITFQAPDAAPPTPAGGFARGGFVGQLAQRFAGGGAVFRRPLWNKVPGTGDADTVPAALTSGSFVIRKAASQFYGDGVLGKLASTFAAGGPVAPIAQRLSSGPGGASGEDLRKLKVATQETFSPLLDAAKTLPRSTTGQNMADWLARVQNLIFDETNLSRARQLFDSVASIADRLMDNIREASQFHVPIVMGAFAPQEKGGVFQATPPSALFDRLATSLTRARFAGGGPAGSDTVPAFLTPGEFVFRPQAVSKYGSGFMHALNNLQVPRGFLDNVINFPAPRPNSGAVARFAEGGPVGSPSSAGNGTSAGVRDVHVHIYPKGAMDEREVDNLITQINKRIRRSN